MNLRLRILGREIASLSTEQPKTVTTIECDREHEWERWKAMNGATGGDFGFGRTDLTAIEEPAQRWETGRRHE